MSRDRSPALIALAAALPVAVIAGFVVAAVLASRDPLPARVAVAPVPAPNAGRPECTGLTTALPGPLGDFARADIAPPAPPATVAWQRSGSEPIVLRCGVDRPAEFNPTSVLQGVNGVQWLEVRDTAVETSPRSTWFAVDRPYYVALTLPPGSGTAPIQAVSDAVAAAMPARPPSPGPLPN